MQTQRRTKIPKPVRAAAFAFAILSGMSISENSSMSANSATPPGTVPLKSWHELPNPKNLAPVNGATYYEFNLPNGSTAHIVVAYIKSGKWRLHPYLSEKTRPTSDISKSQSASAGINGGFFNLSDGASASYVYQDGAMVADPHANKALVENPKLQSFLTQIFDRTELRILKKTGSKRATDIQIAKHSEALPKGMELVDSLQAGPRLLPNLDLEAEAFLRKQADGTYTDAIGGKGMAARTAVGITPDGYAIMLAVSGKGQDPESSGITLAETADLMRRLGCRQAINLDGGSSTSMYVRLAEKDNTSGGIVCAKEPETLVKSVLLLLPQ